MSSAKIIEKVREVLLSTYMHFGVTGGLLAAGLLGVGEPDSSFASDDRFASIFRSCFILQLLGTVASLMIVLISLMVLVQGSRVHDNHVLWFNGYQDSVSTLVHIFLVLSVFSTFALLVLRAYIITGSTLVLYTSATIVGIFLLMGIIVWRFFHLNVRPKWRRQFKDLSKFSETEEREENKDTDGLEEPRKHMPA